MELALQDGKVCLIDEADFDLVTKRPVYRYSKNFPIVWRERVISDSLSYAICNMRISNDVWTVIRMHRLILGLTDPKIQVDHINHNGLDNRRANLRIASPSQNSWNTRPRGGTSRFKGVRLDHRRNVWTAQIGFQKKQIFIGVFKNEIDAAKAYNLKAVELFGERAYANAV